MASPVTLPAPPAPLPDLAPVAAQLATGSPAVVLLLTSPAATSGIAGSSRPQVGFTGTVAADDVDVPADDAGRRPMASPCSCRTRPFEQATAANRRLAADVEAFAPGTKLTPGVAAGYWSADLFLAVLAKVGKHLTRARFLAVANGDFSYQVAGTVGPSTWPRDAHAGRAVRRTRAERRLAVRRGRALPCGEAQS